MLPSNRVRNHKHLANMSTLLNLFKMNAKDTMNANVPHKLGRKQAIEDTSLIRLNTHTFQAKKSMSVAMLELV